MRKFKERFYPYRKSSLEEVLVYNILDMDVLSGERFRAMTHFRKYTYIVCIYARVYKATFCKSF